MQKSHRQDIHERVELNPVLLLECQWAVRNEAPLVVKQGSPWHGAKLRQIEAEGGVDHDITTLGRFTYATP